MRALISWLTGGEVAGRPGGLGFTGSGRAGLLGEAGRSGFFIGELGRGGFISVGVEPSDILLLGFRGVVGNIVSINSI